MDREHLAGSVVGPVRLLMHGSFAAVGAMLGVAVALYLAGPDATGWILAMTAAAVAGAGAWGQLLEGWAVLLRPYGYFGSVIGVAIVVLAGARARGHLGNLRGIRRSVQH